MVVSRLVHLDPKLTSSHASKRRFCRFYRVAPRSSDTHDGCRHGPRCPFIHDDAYASQLRKRLKVAMERKAQQRSGRSRAPPPSHPARAPPRRREPFRS